uniref:Uncharacterized protein n=1 Tax=Chloropicon laureae TaxID=464258 RepID=A0A7S2Z8T1_9CHLO
MVNVSKVPEDIFMVIRVVTLIRGMLAAFACDLSCSLVWEPFARRALAKYNVACPVPEGMVASNNPVHGGGARPPLTRRMSGIFRDMRRVAHWMQTKGLPHNRQALTPMAVHGVTSIKRLAELALNRDPILDSALARFTAGDQERAKALATEEFKEQVWQEWREQAQRKERELEQEAPLMGTISEGRPVAAVKKKSRIARWLRIK